MYEIWLASNIVWEILLAARGPLLLALAVWLLLVVMAARQPRATWRAAAGPALLAGAVVATFGALLLPGASGSSLSEMGYWVDWANLLALSLALGAVAAAFAWPLGKLLRGASA